MTRARSHQDYAFSGTVRLQRRRLLIELGDEAARLASGQVLGALAPSIYAFNADVCADPIVREYESRVGHAKLAAKLAPAARLNRIVCASCMVLAVLQVARTGGRPLFGRADDDAGPVLTLVGVLVAYLLTLDKPGLRDSIIAPVAARELKRLAKGVLAGGEGTIEAFCDLLSRIAEAGGVIPAASLPLD